MKTMFGRLAGALLALFLMSDLAAAQSKITIAVGGGACLCYLPTVLARELGEFDKAGLGYLIQQAEGIFDVAGVFAGMFVLSAFVILIDFGVTLVERRLLVWRPDAAEGRG